VLEGGGPDGALVARIDGERRRIAPAGKRCGTPRHAAIVTAFRPRAAAVGADAIEHLSVRRRDDDAARAVDESAGVQVDPRIAAVAAAVEVKLAAGIDPSRIARIDG